MLFSARTVAYSHPGSEIIDTMAEVARWKGWKIVSVVLLVLVASYLVHFAVTRPAWDWDSILYTMAALAPETPDPVALHARSWALVEAGMSPDSFQAMLDAFPSRRPHRADAVAMVSFLPLYEVKPGYVWIVRQLGAFIDPVQAMRVVALPCALAILAVLFGAAWRTTGPVTLAWLPAAALFGLSSLSTMMTPDPLATMLYVGAFAAILSGRPGIAAPPLVVVTLVRPDSVALNVVLAIALAVESRGLALVVAAGSLAAYGLDLALSGHVGWWRQLVLSFRPPPHDLAGFDPAFNLGTYLAVLREQTLDALHMPWSQAALGLAILAVALLGRRAGEPAMRRAGWLLAALLAGTVLRFVIYPSTEMRHYGPALFGLCLVVLFAAAPTPAVSRPVARPDARR